MRLALNALTDELRRLKAGGVGRVSVSDEAIEALRRSAGSRPAAAAAPPAARPAAPSRAQAPAPAEPAPRPPAALPPPPTFVLPQGGKQARWDALREIVASDPLCRSKLRPGKKLV